MGDMFRVLAIAFGLALGLVPQEGEAADRGGPVACSDSDRHHLLDLLQGASWLPVLEDSSLPLPERLEFLLGDPDFIAWAQRLVTEFSTSGASPGYTLGEFQAPPVTGDPLAEELFRGLTVCLPFFRVVTASLPEGHVFDPKDVEDVEEDGIESAFAALTDPEVPEVLGDALQRCGEAFVAMLGAALVERSNRPLALELARAFSDRAESIPRAGALWLYWVEADDEFEELGQFVAADDLMTLARDETRAQGYVATLGLALQARPA